MSGSNTTVAQGAGSKANAHQKKVRLWAPPAIVPVGPCVCRFNLSQVLLSICLELPRKRSAKGGGIRDARVKVHPVNLLTPEAQDPETQPHFAHSGGRDFFTDFHWEPPTKEKNAHSIW